MYYRVTLHNPAADVTETVVVAALTGDAAAAKALATRDGDWRCKGVHPVTVDGGNSDHGIRAPART